MRTGLLSLSIAAAVAASSGASATIYQFNASLRGANEIPSNASAGTGVATLSYNDFGTASVTDDSYDFTMSVSGLSAAATDFHIHGAASTSESGPVRISLRTAVNASFLNLVSGTSLLVGGNGVAAPASIAATAASATNAGHPSMTFLQMLQGGLAYVNVHTSVLPGGEIRGQFIQVSAVPEPQSYALLLGGLAVVAWTARRHKRT